MSRIGKLPITLPKGVTLAVEDNLVSIKGPLGELNRQITPEVHVDIKEDQVLVLVNDDSKRTRALHGLTRTLLNNMVLGVHKKFEIQLELKGVGYRCQAAKDKVTLSLGFSHPIILPLPKDVEVTVEANTNITVVGIDKEVDNLFLGNIAVLQGPGLIVLILILKPFISFVRVFAKVFKADLDELYEKNDSAQLTEPPEETLIIRP